MKSHARTDQDFQVFWELDWFKELTKESGVVFADENEDDGDDAPDSEEEAADVDFLAIDPQHELGEAGGDQEDLDQDPGSDEESSDDEEGNLVGEQQ